MVVRCGYGADAALRKTAAAGLVILLATLTPLAATAQTVTIAALGDSLTQGYGLPAQDGFVPQLQRWLDAKGADIKLVNAGVSGDTTRGGLRRLDWTLTPDVGGMIVTLGGNDLLRGIDPAFAKQNLSKILAESQKRGIEVLLVGLVASKNFGRDYKAAFDAMYPALAERYGVLYQRDFLGPITAKTDTAGLLAKYLQGDRLHPNAQGVALIVDALGPRVMELAEAVRKAPATQ